MVVVLERPPKLFHPGSQVNSELRKLRETAIQSKRVTRYDVGTAWTIDVPQPRKQTVGTVVGLSGFSTGFKIRDAAEAVNQGYDYIGFLSDTAYAPLFLRRNIPSTLRLHEYEKKAIMLNSRLDEILNSKPEKTEEEKKVVGLAYSGETGTVLHAAIMRPERFSAIAVITPPEKMNIFQLTRGFLKQKPGGDLELGDKHIDPSGLSTTIEIAGHILKSPLRTWRELKAISETDIYDLSEEVMKLGIPIAVLPAIHDEMFKNRRRLQKSTSPFARVEWLAGGHSEPTPTRPTRMRTALRVTRELVQAR